MYKYTKKKLKNVDVGDVVKTEGSTEYRQVVKIDKFPDMQSVLFYFDKEIKKRNTAIFIGRLDRVLPVRVSA